MPDDGAHHAVVGAEEEQLTPVTAPQRISPAIDGHLPSGVRQRIGANVYLRAARFGRGVRHPATVRGKTTLGFVRVGCDELRGSAPACRHNPEIAARLGVE